VGEPWFPHGPLLPVVHGIGVAWPPGRQSRPPAATRSAEDSRPGSWGSGIAFDDRGEHALKGTEGLRRLYAAR